MNDRMPLASARDPCPINVSTHRRGDLLRKVDEFRPLRRGDELIEAALDARERRDEVEREDQDDDGAGHPRRDANADGEYPAADRREIEVLDRELGLIEQICYREPRQRALHVLCDASIRDSIDQPGHRLDGVLHLLGDDRDDREDQSGEHSKNGNQHGQDGEPAREPVLLEPGHQRVESQGQEQRGTDVREDGRERADRGADAHGDKHAESTEQAESERVLDLHYGLWVGAVGAVVSVGVVV